MDQTEVERVVGEARWPMALAVAAGIVLTVLLPGSVRWGPPWLIPLIEALLLAALVIGDPGQINRRSSVLRVLSIVLVSVLLVTALSVTIRLISSLINGTGVTDSADALLRAGALVWVSNNLAFALLYWELDGGGPAARAHRLQAHPGLAFPQQLNPEVSPRDWRPQFVDYFYLGFTNATAFSPTDAMPLAPWAKLAMLLQSLISLVILGLVVARAVNIFH